MESGVLAEPVLVGREQELEELRHLLDLAQSEKGKTVFISAEAGIGKTRLINEFLDSAKQDKNIVTLSGWCLFNAEIPYFPFIEAFSNYYSTLGERSEEEAEISAWLREPAKAGFSGKLKYLSPQALKDYTFEVVAKTIRSIATQNPVILVIEDIHWADSASLALLHYIARAVQDSERVLVLATFRSEELTNDAEGYPHQLVETLAMMRREDLFETICLPHLSPTSVTKLAESMLGGSLQKSLAEKLAVESEGNPLFVVESLRMLNEQDKLVKDKNEWRLTTDELAIPSKFKDIILQRLACLNNAQRRLLDAASVIGEEFDAGLLSAVVHEDSLDVTEMLNVIAHSTSLVCEDENRYRFDHARSREVVYGALTSSLKRGYHSRIAEILESSKSVTLPFSDLAYHYTEAGNEDKAVKYAMAAAKNEMAKWSNEQAIKHFQYVIQNTQENNSGVKNDALEGLGDAYFANCMYKEAIKTFDELAACTNGLVKLHAIRKAMDVVYVKGDQPDLLLEYAERAEKLGVNDRLEMARIIDNRGHAWAWSGRGDITMDLADYNMALRVFEEENSIADVAEALWRSGSLTGGDVGLSRLLRSASIFMDLGDARKETHAVNYAGLSLFGQGLFPEARLELFEALRISEKLGSFDHLAWASHYLSLLDEREGKAVEALSRCLKGLEYCKKMDANYITGLLYACIVRQYCLLGDMKQADEYFERMNSLPREILSQFWVKIASAVANGVYFAAKAQWEESTQAFEKLLQPMTVAGPRVWGNQIWVRGEYAWALERQGRFEEADAQRRKAQELLEQVEKCFGHANLQSSLLVSRKVEVGEEFEIRLDVVNVGRSSGNLVSIEGLIPAGSRVTSLPSFCKLQNGSILIYQKKIEPFHVETLKIRLMLERGVHNFEPCLFYLDDLGETKKSSAKPINVTAQTSHFERKFDAITEPPQAKIDFRTENAEKAFNFLSRAFEEDHISRRMPAEKSGWRTLTEITTKAKIPAYSLYGRHGRGGEALAELEHTGMVESRLFFGERGRGGQVLKLRIHLEE